MRHASRSRRALAVGLLAGTLADSLVPDPRRGHPVAGYGQLVGRVEKALYRPSRARGALFTGTCVVPVTVIGLRCRGAVTIAVATWTVLGASSLRREALAVERHLVTGDLPAAREQLTHLVGRDPSELDAAEIARAAVESVAENTCDAVVAPLFWGAVAGVPGLLGYRAVNTLDAMVGHRSERYARFGWASARLDDVANWVPGRLSAALVAVAAPFAGGHGIHAAVVAARDGRRHPSPNAGWSESAFAGALGIRLGGRNVYGGQVERRPVLGDGRAVAVADLSRAARLSGAVTGLAAVAAAGLADRGVFGRRARLNSPGSSS